MPFCRAGHLLKRVVVRTDEVMVLEDPGQPVGDIGIRRTTRAEDAPQLRTSSAHGSHPGLRPGPGHAPTGPGRLSTLLASAAVPATRCVNRQRCACQSRHDFRRACRVTASDRRPARQGKAPTGLPLQIEAVPALPQPSDRTYADVRSGGDFEPVTASTPNQREVLLEQVKAHVTAELASRQRKRGQGRKDGQLGGYLRAPGLCRRHRP